MCFNLREIFLYACSLSSQNDRYSQSFSLDVASLMISTEFHDIPQRSVHKQRQRSLGTSLGQVAFLGVNLFYWPIFLTILIM